MIDPKLTNADVDVCHGEPSGGRSFAWIAGLAILALIAFVVIAGWSVDQVKTPIAPKPVSLGVCTVTEVGDSSGATVSLDCGGTHFVYTARK